MKRYSVTINRDIEAASAEEAARMLVELLADDIRRRQAIEVRVTGPNERTVWHDARPWEGKGPP